MGGFPTKAIAVLNFLLLPPLNKTSAKRNKHIKNYYFKKCKIHLNVIAVQRIKLRPEELYTMIRNIDTDEGESKKQSRKNVGEGG